MKMSSDSTLCVERGNPWRHRVTSKVSRFPVTKRAILVTGARRLRKTRCSRNRSGFGSLGSSKLTVCAEKSRSLTTICRVYCLKDRPDRQYKYTMGTLFRERPCEKKSRRDSWKLGKNPKRRTRNFGKCSRIQIHEARNLLRGLKRRTKIEASTTCLCVRIY